MLTKNIDPAPLLDSLGNHGFHFIHLGHIGTIGNGFAASSFDHGNGFQCRSTGNAITVHRTAEVVNHDLGAACSQRQVRGSGLSHSPNL